MLVTLCKTLSVSLFAFQSALVYYFTVLCLVLCLFTLLFFPVGHLRTARVNVIVCLILSAFW